MEKDSFDQLDRHYQKLIKSLESEIGANKKYISSLENVITENNKLILSLRDVSISFGKVVYHQFTIQFNERLKLLQTLYPMIFQNSDIQNRLNDIHGDYKSGKIDVVNYMLLVDKTLNEILNSNNGNLLENK